jgi:arylsulfatase A-like enzyme
VGHPVVKTPNIDALAQRGMLFENAYCFGSNSGAVCRPSRNMFLGGKTYFRWRGPDSPAEASSFPAVLKAGGYETWHCGKRGNTAVPIQAQFEHNNYINDDQERTSGHPGREVTEQALAFLEKRDAKRPFFMYLGYETPHDPRVPTKDDADYYAKQSIPLPKNFLPQHPFDNGEMTIRDEQLLPWPRPEAALRDELRAYYGAMTGLDREIGRLLADLAKRGQLDNTIVIFSSDHGLSMGSHGLLGKQNLYEHGMRVPLIMAGPKIPAGQTTALAYLIDLLPTVCGLTGQKIPADLDGVDLTPVIEGKEKKVRDTLFTAYRDVQRAVRDERYKLIVYPQINSVQLFDLRNDPDEMKDLSNDAAMKPTLERLRRHLKDLQERYGDSQPLSVAQPKPAEFVPPRKKK